MLFRVAASLAVAIQRGNFGVLAASAPGLAEAAVRLAMPLSEEPEVWRAAPVSAVELAGELLADGPVPSSSSLPPAAAMPVVG